MNYDTTRKFSRTLSDAYPDIRAHCIEGPAPKNYGRKAVNWTLVLAVWFLITLLAMENMK